MKDKLGLNSEDFEDEVEFEIDEGAFKVEELHCDSCESNMERFSLDVDIPETFLSVHLKVFRCAKCGKEYLNGEEAEKLDRALAISKAITKKGFVYERAGNFDGSNVFVRFPAHMVKGTEIRADIVPISQTEFFVHFKKGKKKAL